MIKEIFIFIFGLAAGSFLNVCIYRMPLGQSIIRPPSFCPNCKKTIFWYDNIPLVSYLLLKGRCRFCNQVIRFRYFIVELLTAIIFVTLFDRFGLSGDYFVFTLFCCSLIIVSFIDIDYRVIPDEISVGILLVGLAINFIKSIPHFYKFSELPIIDSLLGAILGSGLIYVTAIIFNFILFVVVGGIYKLFRKDFYLLKEFKDDGEKPSCIGGGDVNLMAMIGAFLGWRLALFTFFIAPFLGAMVGIYVLIRKRSHLIPYGPFLSLAAFVALLWGNNIIQWIIFLIGG